MQVRDGQTFSAPWEKEQPATVLRRRVQETESGTGRDCDGRISEEQFSPWAKAGAFGKPEFACRKPGRCAGYRSRHSCSSRGYCPARIRRLPGLSRDTFTPRCRKACRTLSSRGRTPLAAHRNVAVFSRSTSRRTTPRELLTKKAFNRDRPAIGTNRDRPGLNLRRTGCYLRDMFPRLS